MSSGFISSFIHAIASLVPASRREGWLRDWFAELEHRRQKNATPSQIVLHAIGAIPDAASVVAEETSTEMLINDIKYTIRVLIKKPMFATVAILTLALGIGANTAIFTLANSILWKALPFESPEELVSVWHEYPDVGLDRAALSVPAYVRYSEEPVFQELAVYTRAGLTLGGLDSPRRVETLTVSYEFLDVLGVSPKLGRNFSENEGVPGQEFVAIASHQFWTADLGADPAAIGRTIELDGRPYQLIGVLPDDFHFRQTVDLITPLAFTQAQRGNWGREFLVGVARIAPDLSFDQASERIDVLSSTVREETGRRGQGVWIQPLREDILGNTARTGLLVLLGAVGFVLLIACVNIANLLMVRAEGRTREVAVRTALGASRFRIVSQFLTESITLSVSGGIVGLLLGIWGVKLITGLPNLNLPRAGEISVDGGVLAFTAFLSIATGLLFGAAPALGQSPAGLASTLRDGAQRSIGSKSGLRSRRVMVATEVALACVLLVGAGLMIKSFARLVNVHTGYSDDPVLTMQLSLPNTTYGSNEDVLRFYTDVTRVVSDIPGVEAAGGIMPAPHSGDWTGSFRVEGVDYPPDQPSPNTSQRYVLPGFFESAGVEVLQGRVFDNFDTESGESIVIVDQLFVDQFIPEGDAVGKRIGFPGNWSTIIAVVENIQDFRLDEPAKGKIYNPIHRAPMRTITLTLRTRGDADLQRAPAIDAIHSLDASLAPFDIMTLEARTAASVADTRLSAVLLGLFAVTAIALAGIGIYGVLAYTVTQRTNEIGIRMALGASQRGVVRMIVSQGLVTVLIGATVGIVGSLALGRLLSSMLFGVGTADAQVLLVVAAVMFMVSLVASAIPAFRASRVDPVEALRYD